MEVVEQLVLVAWLGELLISKSLEILTKADCLDSLAAVGLINSIVSWNATYTCCPFALNGRFRACSGKVIN